ncbi:MULTISPECIES: lipoyl(octanoyl) transferase LipB [unclassified Acidiplasma]|uniref:lipoyl(octanoyl) transferase LipB n=1 Tax=unclassified Acidiplasma TaxID=2641301 RepID=UPI0005E31453|nr:MULTISPECIES: lipoyl(octanoyl) transferase LipB [unclassified Acidiplasma]KJE49250.1 octanoyltransferase [Acidiplasma sp. MBA-1]WMT54781.1 MAG: lipoyl(octanoyl) transferase LipB [Acidiplasma sp.]
MPDIYVLGVEDYKKILDFQRRLNNLRNQNKIDDSFIILEHNDVYTSGVHYKGAMDNIIKTERGGYLTYHGPGQLVAYFIINMKEGNKNVLDVIRLIQKTVTDFLEIYNIDAHPELNEKTGVWVNNKKICSIGLAIKGFSTLHGMALNINTDLKKFYLINPCNFDPEIMTSIEEIKGFKIPMDDARKKYMEILIRDFKIENYNLYTKINDFYI